MKNYLTLDKIDAYVVAFKLSNYVWKMVMKWDRFPRWTVGQQLVESCDSISANIAEGFGRYHKKEKIHFYRYSYGSMEETRDWLRKASIRGLITQEEQEYVIEQLDKLPQNINQLIQFTNEKLKY